MGFCMYWNCNRAPSNMKIWLLGVWWVKPFLDMDKTDFTEKHGFFFGFIRENPSIRAIRVPRSRFTGLPQPSTLTGTCPFQGEAVSVARRSASANSSGVLRFQKARPDGS